jgi:hypothetical protein
MTFLVSALSAKLRRVSGAIENHRHVALLAATALVGLLQFLLLPNRIIVFNDDFGYLRSVVETVQHGRPWTDDWLEPWAASLSVLCAIFWKLTGSFTTAIHGIQVVAVALGFTAAVLILVRRGFGLSGGVFAALVLYSFPTMLWKNCEFTAFPLYIACLLWAIYAYISERWVLYSFVTAVAVASRQSAVAWLAVPLVAGLFRLTSRERNKAGFRSPVLAAAAIAGVYALCTMAMNRTHAQSVMTTAMWNSLQFGRVATTLSASAVIIFFCLGSANALHVAFGRRAPFRKCSNHRRFVAGVGLVIIIVGFVLFISGRFAVEMEHGLFSTEAGKRYSCLLGVVAATGWLARPMRIDIKLVSAAVACAALTSLRGAVWDYYFVDLAIFAYFSVLAPLADREVGTHAEIATARHSLGRIAVSGVLIVVTVALHTRFVMQTKVALDNFSAQNVLAETALREGKIDVADLSFAPFGFTGWYLYPCFVAHDGARGSYIADFTHYLREGSITMQTRGADDPRPLEHAEQVVTAQNFRIAWTGRHTFLLRRNTNFERPTLELNHLTTCFERFPLNDTEWRALLDRRTGRDGD